MNKEKNLKDQRASLRVDTRETQQISVCVCVCVCVCARARARACQEKEEENLFVGT